jgi:hypothetical protein
MDEDDILTSKEEKQIMILLATKQSSIQAKCADLGALAAVSLPLAYFTFERRFGINPHVTINNISGKKAWVILSPAPISSIGSFGVDNIANISFQTTGDYKCQQLLLVHNKSEDYELDTSQIYYSVFFDCDGVWKTPFKNRRINTRKYNINLLERHVDISVDSSTLPVL